MSGACGVDCLVSVGVFVFMSTCGRLGMHYDLGPLDSVSGERMGDHVGEGQWGFSGPTWGP